MKAEAGSGKFHEIFVGIQNLIESDGLRPGDKLPSERELSERLGAGRSSIREVLRSLELLGLISTKRGEGTYLEPYHAHHLVDLLAGFILRDSKSREDLLEMRKLLETGAVRFAIRKAAADAVRELREKLVALERTDLNGDFSVQAMRDFHALIVRMADNYLLTRIWYPVVHFGDTIHPEVGVWDEQEARRRIGLYRRLVEAVEECREEEAAKVMEELFAPA
jgi:GntR family transcriptional regulator, transcriptional repressor for pyruvate dehydrogenase complex